MKETKHLSEAHKKKLSKSLKGRKRTAEQRARISQGMTGRVLSEETRLKMSTSRTGLKRTNEQRARIAAAQRIRRDREKEERALLEAQEAFLQPDGA